MGYEEAGQLTEQVRRHPYSLILLDEIEKAHPDVMHMFLQILDDGRLTDSQGRTVSFKDTIIIMTSNAGSGDTGGNSVGFGTKDDDRNKLISKLENYFKPEFLNRFDDIVEFNELTKDNLSQIIDLMIKEVNDQLKSHNLHVTVDKEVKDKLIELGYNPSMGARPLRRVIQEHLEDKIADFYLENPKINDLKAKMQDDKITIIENN